MLAGVIPLLLTPWWHNCVKCVSCGACIIPSELLQVTCRATVGNVDGARAGCRQVWVWT